MNNRNEKNITSTKNRSQSNGYGNNRKKRRKKRQMFVPDRRTMWGIGLLAAGAAAVILAVRMNLHRTIGRYDPEVIISGVSIGETDVSGMTKEEAKAAVSTATEQYAGETLTLTLENGQQAQVTLGDLGMSVKDLDAIVSDAADYGKKGTAVNCYKILKASEKKELDKNFPVVYEVTKETAGGAIEKALKPLLGEPVNAALTQENGQVVVIPDKPGEVINIEKTVANINDYIRGKRDAKEAEIRAEAEESDAEIPASQLETITDILGSYSTSYAGSSEGRSMNVETASAHINGTFLEPGEEVSVNSLMEPYTEENGYRMAASYAGDEVVESMGGGICQVSTTLYNAILYAELQVNQRNSHSMLVSYADVSRDAAIAEDLLDLKFENNLEDPIYIESYCEYGCVYFNIYGREYRQEGRSLRFEGEIVETTEPGEKRFVSTEDSVGSYYVKSNAQNGYTAQLWKIISQDGEETGREIVNYSTYIPAPETVAVGTLSEDSAVTEKMKEAVRTQNEERIKAAIAECTGMKEEGGE